MVTGRRPFTGTSWHLVNQHIKEQPAPLRTLRPDAPVGLERFVAQLLAKDPAQRPASAGKVRDVLKEINDRHFGATPHSRGKDIGTEVLVTQAEAHPPADHRPQRLPRLPRLRHQDRREGGTSLHGPVVPARTPGNK